MYSGTENNKEEKGKLEMIVESMEKEYPYLLGDPN